MVVSRDTLAVEIIAMKRRHIRAVTHIESDVYPRPWSASLFGSELALRRTRRYHVAKVGREVVGYGGIMLNPDGAHVTTLAVAPRLHRRGIATRLMLTLARDAIEGGADAMTLEVRIGNRAAQDLYRRFGFAPVGVRKNYYADLKEDALVMWVHEIDSDAYAELLAGIERRLTP